MDKKKKAPPLFNKDNLVDLTRLEDIKCSICQ